MKPPPNALAALAHATGSDVTGAQPVGGGCISDAWRVSCGDGGVLFLKCAPPGALAWMLTSEAESLRMLESADAVRVPAVHAVTQEWLALEWLDPTDAHVGAWSELGAGLARLHRAGADRFGRASPNCIGSLPQENEWADDWPMFWRTRRLEPQLELARARLDADDIVRFELLLKRLDELLAAGNEDGASLLHGDLWAGNVHFTGGGAALIDPASYYGHREVDLAMAALFGGFPAAFFDAYSAEWPLLPGAAERRHIYQLYYLLVHVNLFGGGYIAQTRAALKAIAALS